MSNEILDEAGVERKFGVRPERFIDYLTLIGDSIDNVPGVDKVGPKTAAKWIAQYGSLDEVMAQAGEIGGMAGENLRKARDWLPKARELLTIKCDVALPEKVADLAAAAGGHREARGAVRALRAEGVEARLRGWRVERRGSRQRRRGRRHRRRHYPRPQPELRAAASEPRSYETILTEEQLDAWLAKLAHAELAAFDTETTQPRPDAGAPGRACRLRRRGRRRRTCRSRTATRARRRSFPSSACSRG